MKTCPQCSATYDDIYEACPRDGAPLVQPAPPADPLLGKTLAGRYHLIEKIGQGGMGAIYKAIHTRMDRTCAIKLLTTLSSDTENAIARFNREAKMASRIDNPHAVTIYDFGEAETGTLYLAMEFIDGSPLSHMMAAEKQIEPGRVVRITGQICEALTAAHALGIIHRDLKPDNIMITRKGGDAEFVKVLDFGIAKAVADESGDNMTKTGFILGTPVYMSPEQLSGEKLDPRSDIYSLAIIVYEMLSGRLPFEGENTQAIMIKRLMSDPIPLGAVTPSLSETVQRVVMAGLARDRDRRPPRIEVFASELQAAMSAGTRVLSGRATGVITDEPGGRKTVEWSSEPTTPESPPQDELEHGATEVMSSVSLTAPTLPQPAARQASTAQAPSTTAGFKGSAPSKQAVQRVPDSSEYAAPATVPDLAAVAPAALVAPGRVVRTTGRRAVVGAVAAALVVFTAVYIFAVRPGSGFTLMVTGLPSGSEVFVNSMRQGIASADGTLRVSGVSPGDVAVRVSREGFADFNVTVTGKAGEERSVAARLLPARLEYGGAMVLIPAGEFVMGDDSHEIDERPAHTVALDPYYIDEFEVTNEQYKKFCDETHRQYPTQGSVIPGPSSPVLNVTWDDASAYASWAHKRLPTEEEWEKAASWDPAAKKKRQWPWGATPDKSLANLGSGGPVPVDQFTGDVSPYGVHDMAGNAAEMVDGFYRAYAGNETHNPDFGRMYRVMRGGSYKSEINDARTTRRDYLDTAKQKAGMTGPISFRCAVSANDPGLQAALSASVRLAR